MIKVEVLIALWEEADAEGEARAEPGGPEEQDQLPESRQPSGLRLAQWSRLTSASSAHFKLDYVLTFCLLIHLPAGHLLLLCLPREPLREPAGMHQGPCVERQRGI